MTIEQRIKPLGPRDDQRRATKSAQPSLSPHSGLADPLPGFSFDS